MAISFEKRMTLLNWKLMQGNERVIKKAALAALTAAVFHTPVKTGRAIASWMVGLGKPRLAGRNGPNTPSIDTNRSAGGGEAISSGAAAINKWRMGVSGNIYITNPTDYIGELDQGSSRQAPNGMSIFAIEAARAVLRKARLLKNGR